MCWQQLPLEPDDPPDGEAPPLPLALAPPELDFAGLVELAVPVAVRVVVELRVRVWALWAHDSAGTRNAAHETANATSAATRPAGRMLECDKPTPSLSDAYGVSCRASAERAALRRTSGDSPRGPIWPLWVPRSLRLGASETRLGSSFGRAAYTNCKIDVTGRVMESGAGPRGGGARRGPRAGLPAGGRGAARPAGAPGSRGPAPGSRRTRRGGGPPGPRGPRPRAPVRRTLRETSQTPSPPGSKADFSG